MLEALHKGIVGSLEFLAMLTPLFTHLYPLLHDV